MSKPSTESTATKRNSSPDTLIKMSKKGEVELTEDQLDKVTGGVIDSYMNFKALTPPDPC